MNDEKNDKQLFSELTRALFIIQDIKQCAARNANEWQRGGGIGSARSGRTAACQ